MNYLLFVDRAGVKTTHAEGWNDTHTVCGLPCDALMHSDGLEMVEVMRVGPVTCAKCKQALKYFSGFVVK